MIAALREKCCFSLILAKARLGLQANDSSRFAPHFYFAPRRFVSRHSGCVSQSWRETSSGDERLRRTSSCSNVFRATGRGAKPQAVRPHAVSAATGLERSR